MVEEEENTDKLFGNYFDSLGDDTLRADEQDELVKKLLAVRSSLKAGNPRLIDRIGRYFRSGGQNRGQKKYTLRPVWAGVPVLIAVVMGLLAVYRTGMDEPALVKNSGLPADSADDRRWQDTGTDSAVVEGNGGSNRLMLAQIPLRFNNHAFTDTDREIGPTDEELANQFLSLCEIVLAENGLQYSRQNMKIETGWQVCSFDGSMAGISRLILKVNPGNSAILVYREMKQGTQKDRVNRKTIADRNYRKIIKEIKTKYYSTHENHE